MSGLVQFQGGEAPLRTLDDIRGCRSVKPRRLPEELSRTNINIADSGVLTPSLKIVTYSGRFVAISHQFVAH